LIINMKQIIISGTVTKKNALIRLMNPINLVLCDRLEIRIKPNYYAWEGQNSSKGD